MTPQVRGEIINLDPGPQERGLRLQLLPSASSLMASLFALITIALC